MRPHAAAHLCGKLFAGLEGALGGLLAPAPLSLAQAAERLHDCLRPLTKNE